MSLRVSIATRVAGAIGALGYLLGLVDGPFLGALAGLALIAFGRALIAPRGLELIAPLGFAVLAGASGVVALRWGTLEIADIRGVQGVLGPTIAVDPQVAAVAAGAAWLAATLALGIWLAPRTTMTTQAKGIVPSELVAGSVWLATLFVGPPFSDIVRVALFAGAAGIAAVSAWGAGRLLNEVTATTFSFALGGCGAVVIAAAAVTGAVT